MSCVACSAAARQTRLDELRSIMCGIAGFIGSGSLETLAAMTDALDDGQKQRIDASIPAGRMGEAGEIASAVVYLASDEAAYVTGQTLHVNGGMAMI